MNVAALQSFKWVILSSVLALLALSICVYLAFLKPRVSPPMKRKANNAYAPNGLLMFELQLETVQSGGALVCKKNIRFVEAFQKKRITHIILQGNTFALIDVITNGKDTMIVKVRKIVNGINRAEDMTYTAFPKSPTTMYIIGYFA